MNGLVPGADQVDARIVDLYAVRMRIIDPASPLYGTRTVATAGTLEQAYAWRDDIALTELGRKVFADVEIVSARVTVGPWELMSVAGG